MTKLAKEYGYPTADALIEEKCPSELGCIDDFEICVGEYEEDICRKCWQNSEKEEVQEFDDDEVFRLTRKAFETDEEYEAYLKKCDELSGREPKKGEQVNHPAHYQGAHECIEVMRHMFGDSAVRSFCKCNAFKYRFRANMKNGEEDIKKAEWYEDYLIKMDSMNYDE